MTREERVRNEYVKRSIGVASMADKMRENRPRRFGRVTRREETETARAVVKTEKTKTEKDTVGHD